MEIGARVGPYVIVSVAGQGGMGTVYRATDELLGRAAALKMIRPEVLDDDALARFLREGRIAAQVRHPCLPVVFEVAFESETPYLATEWIEGDTLRTLLLRKALSASQKLRCLRELAEVLAFLHERGIVHRDVKPANVMIDQSGATKLLDFGVAKHAKGAPRPSPLTFDTADGVVMGTPSYMAPEQLHAEGVGPKADQFAWGAVAYEVLTGVTPGRSMGPSALFPFERPRPCASVAVIDPRLGALVNRALEPSPPARFETMAVLLAEWQRFEREALGTTEASLGAARGERGEASRSSGGARSAVSPVSRERSSAKGLYWKVTGLVLLLGLAAFAVALAAMRWAKREEPTQSPRVVDLARSAPIAPAPVPEESAVPSAAPSPLASTKSVPQSGSSRGGRCFCGIGPSGGPSNAASFAYLCAEAARGPRSAHCVIANGPIRGHRLCRQPYERDDAGEERCRDDAYSFPGPATCSGYPRESTVPLVGRIEIVCADNSFHGVESAPCRGLTSDGSPAEGRLGCR